jgi:hypothetical protein
VKEYFSDLILLSESQVNVLCIVFYIRTVFLIDLTPNFIGILWIARSCRLFIKAMLLYRFL